MVPHHPCQNQNGGCQHICVPAYRKGQAYAQCLCAAGYHQLKGRCFMRPPSTFIVYAKGKPAMVKGIADSPSPKNMEVMIPITNVDRPFSLDCDVKSQYIYFSDRWVQRFFHKKILNDFFFKTVINF